MRLARLLPSFIKRPIKAYVTGLVETDRPYISSHPGADAYCVLPVSVNGEGPPIPPRELWLGMAEDAQSYITSGQADVESMARIVGGALAGAERVLEFGCATGRMLRHLPERTAAELWGVDISAVHIGWCIDNLPQMHFATTTIVPHLPFEDRFFDFIFCGSVFTHIEDTRDSWLLELGRTLRPSGRLYLTIHDEHTVKLLETKYREWWLAKQVREHPVYLANKDNFAMIVIGRGSGSQVFYDSEYFKAKIPSVFRCVSYTRAAYGYQSGVLLEKI